jgi:4-amino-4-deoxy-L-arabinose transferase-like glycosyltransferase
MSDSEALVSRKSDGVHQRLKSAYLSGRLATDWLYVSGLVAISLLFIFVRLGGRALWDIDEGMHSVIAQNMVNSGDWITPVFNGEPFLDKPPLFNWLGAACFSLFGFSESVARLPSAILGLGCVLITYLLGRQVKSRATGFVAAIILVTSLEFMVLSRMVQYDVPFTFFTTLSLYFFCSALLLEQYRTPYLVGFYIATALAILTKGPLGLLLPATAIGLFLMQQRRWSYLREMKISLGASLIALIAAPWFLLMEAANPGYLEYFVMHQHLGNFFAIMGSNSSRHPEPIYYYLPVLIAGMFPWSMLVPQAFIAAIKGRVGTVGNSSTLLLAWIVSIFVFFSLASSKLLSYILPVFPAIAVLLGAYLVEFGRSENRDRPWRKLVRPAGAGLLVIGSATVYVLFADPWAPDAQMLGFEWHHFEWLLVSLTVVAAVVPLILLVNRYVSAFALASLIMPILLFYVLIEVAPRMDTYKSGRDIGLEYAQTLGPGQKMIFANKELDSAMFYANRESVTLRNEQEIRSILNSDRVTYLVLTRNSDAATDRILNDYYVIRNLGNKSIVGNRPLKPDREPAKDGSGNK